MPPRTAATRVLIIDSDNVRRGMLACTLPATRYRLQFAPSLEKGLDLLARQEPQLVIVGGADSRDACQCLRTLPAGQRGTLILMDESFRDEVNGRSQTEAAGADLFLPFPFEIDLLEHKLALLKQAVLADAASTPTTAPQLPATPQQAESCAAAPPTPETTREAWTSFRERVLSIYQSLESTTYYALLETTEGASSAGIKQAYFERSMEFHPDRFMRLDDEELKSQIYEIFKRMSEAFKVLSSPEARSRYDANLAGSHPELRYLERPSEPASPDPVEQAATPAGRKYLRFALLAQEDGNLRSARMYLSMAAQYEPDNDELHRRLKEVTRRLSG